MTQQDFDSLLEASRLLASERLLSNLLKSIMELAARVMRAEAGSVLLLDEKTNELYFNAAAGGAGDSLRGMRIPVGHGIAGWVAKEGKPVIANDVTRHPQWQGDLKEGIGGFTTRSMMACPMLFKGNLVGVLQVINRPPEHPFVEKDLQLFEAFASQAAVAVENARLFESLVFEKEKFRKIFDEMADGAMLVDHKGDILSMNRRAAQWFEGLPLLNIRDFDPRGYLWDPQPQGLLASAAKNGTLEIRRPQPKLFILSGIWSRFEDAHGNGSHYLFLFRDVTDERREAFLQRNFLSLISHKLRTPLVAITGYLPLLRQEWDRLSETQRKCFEAIEREGRHLNYLVEDLLRFTMVSGPIHELKIARNRISAARIIEDALYKISLLTSSFKVQIIKQLDPAAEITGDTEMLIDMAKSLMENAIQFNDKAQKELRLEAVKSGQQVMIRIADNGPGIPPEERDRIFRWFYQIDQDFTGQVHGMGLGLAFVKKVVDLHRGRIELTSELGKGSCFTIFLPAT